MGCLAKTAKAQLFTLDVDMKLACGSRASLGMLSQGYARGKAATHCGHRGFMLQITSQFAECSKNLIGEVLMTGAGMK